MTCLEGLSYASRLGGFCVIPTACCKSGGNAMVSADWLPFCESILSLKDGTSSLSGTGMEPWLISPWPLQNNAFQRVGPFETQPETESPQVGLLSDEEYPRMGLCENGVPLVH